MIAIDYPEQKPALRKTKQQEEIFCLVRKRWMLLTPEEWVRQNLILWFTRCLGYPLSLIAVEKQIRVGELIRRFDVLLHNPSGQPILMLECKEMNTELSDSVWQQAMRYNIPLQAGYLLISNGRECLGCRFRNGVPEILQKAPLWTEIM